MSSEVFPMKSKIQSFYEDKTIFLTGVTGFLGKVLVEKLLRSCPGIKRVYLLIRAKRGMSAEERLKKMLECEVFARLRHDRPEFRRQLVVTPGDLTQPLLGLSPDHVTAITSNVHIIFHSAATIRFDESLSLAITTNIAATRQLCLLAQNMANLQAFVYVSTAYSNCDSHLIQEKVLPSRISPENLIKLPDLLDDRMLDEITPLLLGSKPNTYVFTKCAAEGIIDKFKVSLPVAIFRPSIVVPAVSDPMPGWIDNVLGPTGVVVSLSTGLLHTVQFKGKAKGNFVPVDFTVNAIIALAYSIGQRQWDTPEELRVVNFVSTADNTITWGRLADLVEIHVWRNPSANLVWYPFTVRAAHPWSYRLLRTLLHSVPAAIIDWCSAVMGRPTRLRQFYHKLDRYAAVVTYFSTREFRFEEGNAARLWRSLDRSDQTTFPFDMATLRWDAYVREYVRGCRRFLLNEDPATLAASRRRVKLLYLIHLIATSGLFFILLQVIFFIVRIFRKLESLKITEQR